MAKTYRLTAKAEEDVIRLYAESAKRFGIAQAEAYYAGLHRTLDFLAANPMAARERPEIAPSIRVHPYRTHLVVYTVYDGGVLVVRVRHRREDWTGDGGAARDRSRRHRLFNDNTNLPRARHSDGTVWWT